MNASDKLRELIKGGAAYVERGELGNKNVVPANRLMDALMESRYQLLAVVEAAEMYSQTPAEGVHERHLILLREALADLQGVLG